MRRHLKNIHNYDPQPGDLKTKESRFFECFHCDEVFHLAWKKKLLVHLTTKHFMDLKVDGVRRPLRELKCYLDDGLYKCKKCDMVVGSFEKFKILNNLHLRKCTGKKHPTKLRNVKLLQKLRNLSQPIPLDQKCKIISEFLNRHNLKSKLIFIKFSYKF